MSFYFMKEIIKSYSSLFNTEATITIDEKLNRLKGKNLAPKKLEQANKQLRKLKSLPQ